MQDQSDHAASKEPMNPARLDSLFPLMYHELSDPGSVVQIKMNPKEHTDLYRSI